MYNVESVRFFLRFCTQRTWRNLWVWRREREEEKGGWTARRARGRRGRTPRKLHTRLRSTEEWRPPLGSNPPSSDRADPKLDLTSQQPQTRFSLQRDCHLWGLPAGKAGELSLMSRLETHPCFLPFRLPPRPP